MLDKDVLAHGVLGWTLQAVCDVTLLSEESLSLFRTNFTGGVVGEGDCWSQ